MNTSTALQTVKTNERGLAITSLAEVSQVASMIYASGLAPKSFNTPQQVAVAIMAGLELGYGPMAALQALCVINNKVQMYGDAPISKCRASGQLEAFDEWFEDDQGKIALADGAGKADKRITAALTAGSLVAVCSTKRKNESPYTDLYSCAMAKKAGLLGKAGPWQTEPVRMLRMRARSRVLRAVYPDALGQVAILEDSEPALVDAVVTTAEAPKTLADLKAQAQPVQAQPGPSQEVAPEAELSPSVVVAETTPFGSDEGGDPLPAGPASPAKEETVVLPFSWGDDSVGIGKTMLKTADGQERPAKALTWNEMASGKSGGKRERFLEWLAAKDMGWIDGPDSKMATARREQMRKFCEDAGNKAASILAWKHPA